MVATCLVIIVNLQVALDSSYWTYFNHVTIWGSIAVYFVLQFSVNYILVYWGVDAPYVGCLTMVSHIFIYNQNLRSYFKKEDFWLQFTSRRRGLLFSLVSR